MTTKQKILIKKAMRRRNTTELRDYYQSLLPLTPSRSWEKVREIAKQKVSSEDE